MASSSQKVPYPDNLWTRVFGENHPVPADADETLTALRQAISSERTQKILDLRFKEGKTAKEVGEVVGLGDQQVRILIERAIGAMVQYYRRDDETAALSFGINVRKLMAEGRMGVCYKCHRLIKEDAEAFVAPIFNHLYSQRPSRLPVLKLFCSRECAEASVSENVEGLEYSTDRKSREITRLQKDKDILEQDVQLLRDYKPEPMTFKEAHSRVNAKKTANS